MSNAKDNVLPKWLQLGSGIATVTLSRPSEANGIQVDKLTLREPTVREMRAATLQGGSNEEEQEMVFVLQSCEHRPRGSGGAADA